MIAIQAIMNPMGIILGWILSGQGSLITGIFQAISAGKSLNFLNKRVYRNFRLYWSSRGHG